MADVLPTVDSGAAGTEYQTIRALERLGHEVDALWEGTFAHKIRHGNLHYLFELPSEYRKTMQGSLAAKDYDVVHINQPHGYLAAKALSRSESRSVLIHRSHGFEMRVEENLKPWRKQYYDYDGRPLFNKLASKIVALGLSRSCRGIALHADGHIVSASQCRDFLRDGMRVPAERIAVIPQAAANSFLEQPATTMTAKRLTRVLYVGQFAFVKAPMIVAAAMNQLSQANQKLEFTWVCSRQHHPQVRALLTSGVRDRVRLVDWMPQEELMQVYDSHGLFLFPSFFEGFGKAFLEAMSRGLCVVAADNGGAHDVIANEVSGMLTPTGDVDAMANACFRLLGDHNTAVRMSNAAAKTARAYTWDRVARETVAFYEDRLAAKAGRLSE